MNNTKALCNLLNSKEIPAVDYYSIPGSQLGTWSPDLTLMKLLENLPEENFKATLKMDYSGYSCFEDVLSEWARQGVLRFDPKIVTDSAGLFTTLMIRYDKYLHLFNSDYFSVSVTPGGKYPQARSSFNVNFLFDHRQTLDEFMWTQSKRVQLLCYAAVIDAVPMYRNVREWLAKSPNEFDEFVHTVFHGRGLDLPDSCTWSSMKEMFTESTDWDTEGRTVYRLIQENRTLCEFLYGSKTIKVRKPNSRSIPTVLTLSVPGFLDGVNKYYLYDLCDVDGIVDDFKQAVSCPYLGAEHENMDLKMLLVLALEMAGFYVNWSNSYAVDKSAKLRLTNVSNFMEIESLRDILKVYPDEF